jgi:ribose 5-phosphate isomerase B
MTIFIAADHRGLELKNQLIEYLQEKDIRVEDLGPYEYNTTDDYPDFAHKVAQAVSQHPQFLGVLICGSGIGMCIAANRHKNILCGLGYDEQQTKHGRENDHINLLALPSDYIDFEKTKRIVDAFITAKPKMEGKYIRRIKKIDGI